jgi:membrane protein required for colicin V production
LKEKAKGFSMGQISAADMVLGAISVYWIGKGFWIGFSGEIFSLLGILAGLLISFKWSVALARFFLEQGWTPRISEGFLVLLCGVLLFTACNLAAAWVCRLTRKGLKAVRLGGLDRALGALAGGAKATILVLFLFGSSHLLFNGVQPKWVSESFLLKTASQVWPETERILAEWKVLDLQGASSFSGEPRQ